MPATSPDDTEIIGRAELDLLEEVLASLRGEDEGDAASTLKTKSVNAERNDEDDDNPTIIARVDETIEAPISRASVRSQRRASSRGMRAARASVGMPATTRPSSRALPAFNAPSSPRGAAASRASKSLQASTSLESSRASRSLQASTSLEASRASRSLHASTSHEASRASHSLQASKSLEASRSSHSLQASTSLEASRSSSRALPAFDSSDSLDAAASLASSSALASDARVSSHAMPAAVSRASALSFPAPQFSAPMRPQPFAMPSAPITQKLPEDDASTARNQKRLSRADLSGSFVAMFQTMSPLPSLGASDRASSGRFAVATEALGLEPLDINDGRTRVSSAFDIAPNIHRLPPMAIVHRDSRLEATKLTKVRRSRLLDIMLLCAGAILGVTLGLATLVAHGGLKKTKKPAVVHPTP